MVLASAISWQIFAPHMYYVMTVSAGLEMPGEGFAQLAEKYFKSTAAVIILFYSALWSVKISFLLFFRRLGTNVQGQKLIWWPVFGITVATYFACIGTIQYQCLLSSFEYLAANCATPAATSFQQITLKLNCAWDVITDCLSKLISHSMHMVLITGSHVHTNQYAQRCADEMAQESRVERYLFSRHHHHDLCNCPRSSCRFEQHTSARQSLVVHVDRDRGFHWFVISKPSYSGD